MNARKTIELDNQQRSSEKENVQRLSRKGVGKPGKLTERARNLKLYTLSHKGEIRYVGITSKSLKKRLIEHISEAKTTNRQNHKVNWIRKVKYDIQINFVKNIVSPDEEILFIEECVDKGIKLTNTSSGGECQWCFGMPEEVKNKIRRANKRTNASRSAKLSKIMKGRVLSKEVRAKISKALTGKQQPMEIRLKKSKAVNMFDKHMNFLEEFYSISEASRKTNISKGAIHNVCAGRQKTAGGYKWRFKI